MRLQDQVALVTGANRGIGRAIARAFAAEGAQVAVTGRSLDACQQVAEEIRAAGGAARAYALDVTDDASVAAASAAAWDELGGVDVLVNSAGIIQYDTPVWQTSIEDFDRMMQVNLRGTFLVCHHLAPRMKQRGQGVIINMGSSSARMADDDLGPYTASKWAVAGYTTSLARSLRPHGVRVNGINPGWVDTQMSRDFQAEGDPDWSDPREIAACALFLAAEAPRDMTGQFLDVFGS